jgi:tetratricopeptide (TPR) repeat protein
MRSRFFRAGFLCLPAACGPGVTLELPRLTDEGLDPLLRVHAERALAACERGEEGALLELAKLYESNNQIHLALAAYDLCLARLPEEVGVKTVELHFHRGRVLAELERAEEAERAFAQAIALGDAYAPSFWRRAQVLLELGRTAEARADLERALELEPACIPARLALARILLLEDRPADVLTTLEPLAARQPDERLVHGLLARARQALGDEQRARAAQAAEEKATRMTSNDPRTTEAKKRVVSTSLRLRRASEALARDRPEEAVKELESLFADAPRDLAVLQTFARALVQSNEHARALEVLAPARALYPDDFKLELYTGLALQGARKMKEASEHFMRARVLNESYGPTHIAIGEHAMKNGRASEAERAFQRALACPDVVLRTYLSLGEAQRAQSAWERAAETYRQASERFLESAAPLAFLAEVELRQGAPDAARATLAEAERRNASHPHIAEVRRLLAEAESR